MIGLVVIGADLGSREDSKSNVVEINTALVPMTFPLGGDINPRGKNEHP